MKQIQDSISFAQLVNLIGWLKFMGFEKDHKTCGTGVDAMFIAADAECGMKFFREEHVAKLSYHMNRILYHFGYTPKVWGFDSIELADGTTIYGFMVERVRVIGEEDMWPELTHTQFWTMVDKARTTLKKRLSETHLINLDLHEFNIGIKNDGTPICIDVGHIGYDLGNYGCMIFKNA